MSQKVTLGCYGVSVVLDLLQLGGIDTYLFEDGAKLIGIVSWLVYLFRVGECFVDVDVVNMKTAPGDLYTGPG